MNLSFGDFNTKVSTERGRQYAKNSAENYQRIKEDFLRADYSIDTLTRFDPSFRVPALILGSGPSLDDTLPYIKDFKGVIFGSPSQLNILEKWEIAPQYIVAVDPADCVGEEQIPGHDTYGMTLLTHPYISPKTLEAWKGNKRYFELVEETCTHFKDIYPWVKIGFSSVGSVNNMQVQIARWMGLGPIILAGVDYCYPGNRMRAQDYRKRGPYMFDPKPLEYSESRNGLTASSQENLFYANILLGLWKINNIPLVQVGDRGACTEIPFIPPEDILKPIDIQGPTPEQIQTINESMVAYGMFAEVDSQGVGHFSWAEKDVWGKEIANAEYRLAEIKASAWSKGADGRWKHE